MDNRVIKTYDESDEREIKKLLLGRKITKISDSELELDNGLVLEVVANEGCGGCGSGWYAITELNGCENAITSVELDCDSMGEYGEYSYKIFVIAEDKRLKILQVDGDDGNGWYGTGYQIYVREKQTA